MYIFSTVALAFLGVGCARPLNINWSKLQSSTKNDTSQNESSNDETVPEVPDIQNDVIPPSTGPTYFIDPVSGDNSRTGLSISQAWKSLPGARTANNSGYQNATWGSITTTNKISCGSKILLKAGTTYQGGSWQIGPDYFSSCTEGAPIHIKVSSATEWPGSSGDFTFNGSGITPSSPQFVSWSDHSSLISVAKVNYVYLRGDSQSRKLVVTNSSSWAVTVHCNGCQGEGFLGQWWVLKNGSSGAFNIGNYSNWKVANALAHDFYRGAWQAGMNNDQNVDRGGFVDVEVYNSGPSTSMTGADDAFFFVGGKSIWCVRCNAHDNNQRGFNTGVINNFANVEFNYRFRNIIAHDNGLSCSIVAPTLYCLGAGLEVSGNEWDAPAKTNNVIVGGLFYHNRDGGAGNYAQAGLEIWNSTFYRTHYNRADTSSIMWDTTSDEMKIFNSVDLGRPGFKTFSSNNSNAASPQPRLAPITGNNCFSPGNSDNDTLGLGGAGNPGAGTYASPPSWIGSSNFVGLSNCIPQFTALDDSNFALTNFKPLPNSMLKNHGRFLMVAAAAGTNSTTVNVQGNGGSSDPRQYFISPDSYLLPSQTDRQIYISGCGARTVTSLSSNSISFSPSCSWNAGAGIHLPINGMAPVIGAIE